MYVSIFVAMFSACVALSLQIASRTRIEPVLLLTWLVLVLVFVIASPKEVVFSSAFVCLFVCQQNYGKTTQPIFHKIV